MSVILAIATLYKLYPSTNHQYKQGARISAKDRLQAIGNGWDVNVVKMLLRFSKLVSAATRETVSKQSKLANVESNVEPTVELSETDRLHQVALAELQESEGDEAVCDLISKLPVEKQDRLMKLLTDMNRSKILTIRADSGGSVLDSGESAIKCSLPPEHIY